MEKEFEKKCSDVKQTEKTALSRRSSILKPPKIQNEENTFRTSRRVSFSSNFIKAFATDEHRNTIWDTTVEEALSGTESSHSQNMQDRDLNTTIIDHNVIDVSSDEEIEGNFQDVKELKEQLPQNQRVKFCSQSDNADISEVVEITGSNTILTANTTKHTNIGDITTTMDLTCMNLTLNPNLPEPPSRADISEAMEFTCRNPTLTSNPSAHNDIADMSTNMDFTRMDLTLNPNHPESPKRADVSEAMEFTCRNATLASNPSRHTNVADIPTTMEFTCINPTLQSNPDEPPNRADISETMEFTCRNATLTTNSSKPKNVADISTTMEFTCMNPILKSNLHESPNVADISETMEFTCRNPTLTTHPSKPKSVADISTTMEFTCMNPILKSKASEPPIIADTSEIMEFTCRNPTLITNPSNPKSVADISTTMEFTCMNPILKSKASEPPIIADTSEIMEFTCRNPTLTTNASKPKSVADISTTMEFTCMNPILKSKASEPPIIADTSETMEFTCRNPTLTTNPSNPKSFADISTTMEFTCMNPILKSKASDPLIIADTSETMEFTCRNPTFTTNPSNPKSVADISTTMEFTCMNPILKSKASEPPIIADTSEIMEFTCRNPTLTTNPSNPKSVADISTTMEFTCMNPILKSKASEPPIIADTSETMEFTCRNRTLTTNPSKPKNVVDVSTTMEFTCMNPILKSKTSNHSNVADSSTAMNFTCTNPTLKPSYKDEKNISTKFKKSQNPSAEQEIYSIADETNTTEFPMRKILDRTNISNISGLDCSKGISLIQNVEQSSIQPLSNMSLMAIEKGEPIGDLPALPDITLPTMEFTCMNPTLKPSYKDEKNISTKFQKSQNPSAEQEIYSIADETNTTEFPLRKFLDRTNISNISGLDCSKGISLIQNVVQSSIQPLSNMSLIAIEKGGPIVDLPALPDITLPTMQSSHLLENISTLPVSDTSRHQLSNTSMFIEKGPTVDLPSLHLLDNTKLTVPSLHLSQNISTVPVSNMSHQLSSDGPMILGEVPVVDLPSSNLPGNATGSRCVTDISTNLDSNISVPLHYSEELSVLQTQNSSTQSMDSLHKSNINLSTSSFCNADDTLQLLRDASRLNRTRNITYMDDFRDNTSGIQMDKTYLVKRKERSFISNESNKVQAIQVDTTDKPYLVNSKERSYISKEGNKVQTIQVDNTDKTYLVNSKERSFISTEDNKMHTIQVDNTRLEDSAYEESGSSTKDLRMENESRVDLTREGGETYSNEEKQPEEHTDLFSNCGTDFPKDNYILAEETLELSVNGTEQLEICATLRHEEKDSLHEGNPGELSGDVWMDPDTERESSGAVRAVDSKEKEHAGLIKSWEELQFPPLEDTWTRRNAELDARIEKLKEISAGYNRNILKNFELFKKRLDHAIETCRNNQIVPEEVSEDEVVDNDEELDRALHDKNGILEKIEKKSKICDDSWKMIKVEHGVAKFTTFFKQLEVTLDYSPHDYKVVKIETKSLLTAKARPIAFLMQKELLRLLSPPHIKNSIGLHYNILSLLDYIQMVMEKIRKCYTTLKDLEKLYDLKLSNEHKASFMILNENLVFIWDFTVDLSDLENITEGSVSVNARIGEVDAKHVLKLVSECPRGLEFLNSYIIKIKEYIETLMKRGRVIGLKKCDKVNN